MDFQLEPSAEQMRHLISEATERVVQHLAVIESQPASYDGSGAAELAAELAEDWPEVEGLEQVFSKLFGQALEKTYNAAHPGYLAFVPGGGLYYSAVADFIASNLNRYTSVWLACPGLVQLETNVLRWFCRLVDYPPEALGLLTTGGSMAHLSAIVAAREEKLGEDFTDGLIYVGDQVHYCVEKALRLAGFPTRNIRRLPCDEDYRLSVDALAKQLEDDLAHGGRPFLVVASAGTTNTGAVDDLAAISALCQRYGLWFSVDAAYGGFFALTAEGKRLLAGLHLADSIILDPHKGLFLPFGNGCLLVKDRETLRRSHADSADYMPQLQSNGDHVDYCQMGPELSRDYRGLRLWLPIKLMGFTAFSEALEQRLLWAQQAEGAISQIDDVEVLAKRQLSLFAFRHAPAELSEEELNLHNRALIERVNARGRVFLTGTQLAGRFALRVCVLHLRTNQRTIDALVEDVASEVARSRSLR